MERVLGNAEVFAVDAVVAVHEVAVERGASPASVGALDLLPWRLRQSTCQPRRSLPAVPDH